jgi:hypothetical protein
MEIVATYITHYEPLVLMVQELFGYEGMSAREVDEIISGMMFIMEAETEEEAFTMMSSAMTMGEGLMLVTDLADFQAWYAVWLFKA